MRFHFGSVSKNCSAADLVDLKNGKLVAQPQADALYPIDTKALVPKCVTQDSTGKDIVVYEQGENIWLWVSAGLTLLLLLILVFAALKGGGQGGTVIYR
jgi:hypothetical protein